MKQKLRTVYGVFCLLLLTFLFTAYSPNPPDGRTGAPGEGTCIDCHEAGNVYGLDGNMVINGLPATVNPGQTYSLTVTVNDFNGLSHTAGFQIVALNSSDTNVGTMSNPSTGSYISTAFNGRTYFEHAPHQEYINNMVSWTVDWTAPTNASTNEVITFYGAANISDVDDAWTNSGNDLIVFTEVTTTVSGGSTQMPDLSVSNITNWSGNYTQGDVAFFNFDLNNISAVDVQGEFLINIYISGDQILGPEDVISGTIVTGDTPVGTISQVEGAVTIPSFAPDACYYLIIEVDANNSILEEQESNNVLIGSSTICVQMNNPLALNVINVQEILCNGDTNGSVTATPTGGTAPYTYQWSNGMTSPSISNLGAGFYQVTVNDSNGGILIGSTSLVEPSALSLVWSDQFTNAPCNANENTGSLGLNVSGGTAGYQYAWNNQANTNPIFGLSAGTYFVTVTDANSCQSTSSNTLEAVNVSISMSGIQPSCGDQNGSVSASASNGQGTGSYTYNWSNGFSGPSISNLGGGIYNVTVVDDNNCEFTESYELIDSEIVLTVAESIAESCEGANDGTAFIIGSGGTGPYVYTLSNGTNSTNGSFVSLSPATYVVTITDAQNCTEQSQFTIPAAIPIDITFSNVVNVDCGGGATGSATAVAQGGAGNFTYSWSNGENSATANNLGIGTHIVEIYDGNQCYAQSSVAISGSSSISISANSIQNNDCNGALNGAISVNASGGTPPLNYNWSNGSTTNTISNLSSGQYFLSVTDANDCVEIGTYTITEPTALQLNVNQVSAVSCNGASDGSYAAQVSGGVQPYTLLWSNGMIGQSVSNLAAGMQSITFTDSNGCEEIQNFEVQEPQAISINVFDVVDVDCGGGSQGSASASATGGQGGFTYNWSNGQTGSTATGLSAGSYQVTATDLANCEEIQNFNISGSSSIIVTLNSIQNNDCAGEADGAISVNASGGTPPLTYNWSNGASMNNINNLLSGQYFLSITDANDCVEVETFTITAPAAMELIINQVSAVSCNGASDGNYFASLIGGVQPYSLQWSNGMMGQSVTNLSAGMHSATFTDGNGCEEIQTFQVNEPELLIVSLVNVQDPNCFDATDGSITAISSGGNLNVTYGWSSAQSGAMINNLSSGNYTVTVTDELGCSATESITLEASVSLDVSINEVQAVSCNGLADAVVMAEATTNSPPLSYAWSTGNSGAQVTGLSAGTYTVTVSAAGCSEVQTINFNEPSAISVNVFDIVDVDCGDTNVGSASVSASGGQGGFTFNWSNGQTGTTATALSPGSYQVTATDNANCEEVQNFNISGSSISIAVNNIVSVDCFGASTGAAQVNASGGTPPLVYQWSNGTSGNSINFVSGGDYVVSITDGNDCLQTETITIPESPALVLNFVDIVHITCNGGTTGSAFAQVSGGAGQFSLQWSNGAFGQSVGDLLAGDYAATLTDGNGCSVVETFEILESSSIVVTVSNLVNPLCPGEASGSAEINYSGGTAPYEMNVIGPSSDLENLWVGAYEVQVSDADGCTASVLFDVASSDTEAPTMMLQNAFSSLDSNGELNNIDPSIFIVSSEDNCTDVMWEVIGGPFTCEHLGDNEVMIFGTDASGNVVSDNAVLTIEDTSAPVLNCSPNLTYNTGCPTQVLYNLPSVSDNCTEEFVVDLIAGFPTGAEFPIGSNEVVYEVYDDAGNVSTCSFIVQVNGMEVQIGGNEVSCFGAQDGSLNVTVENVEGELSYLWSTGDTTSVLTEISGGEYNVSITAEAGCEYVETIIVFEPEEITTSDLVVENEIGNNGNGMINYTAIGGQGPYSFSWTLDGEFYSFQQNLENLSAGTYVLTIMDSEGCESTNEFVIESVSGIFDAFLASQIDVFPNPTSGTFYVDFKELNDAAIIDVFDMVGKKCVGSILKEHGSSQMEINLNDLPQGVYTLRIQMNNTTAVKRVSLTK